MPPILELLENTHLNDLSPEILTEAIEELNKTSKCKHSKVDISLRLPSEIWRMIIDFMLPASSGLKKSNLKSLVPLSVVNSRLCEILVDAHLHIFATRRFFNPN